VLLVPLISPVLPWWAFFALSQPITADNNAIFIPLYEIAVLLRPLPSFFFEVPVRTVC